MVALGGLGKGGSEVGTDGRNGKEGSSVEGAGEREVKRERSVAIEGSSSSSSSPAPPLLPSPPLSRICVSFGARGEAGL